MSKKSRKLIRQQGATAAPEATPAAQASGGDAQGPYAEYADRDWNFHFLPDADTDPADERALHRLMQAWRHGRASRTIGQVLGDAYFMIFSLAVIGAMVVNLVLTSQRGAAGCTTVACQSSRGLLPWALLFAVGTLTLVVARIFGPVLASAAEGFWLMDAPVSRSRLLGGRLRAAVLLAFLLPAPIAVLITMLSGLPASGVVAWTLATAAFSAALMAYAAFEQTAERTWSVQVVQWIVAALATAVVVWLVLVSAGVAALALPGWAEQAPWAVAAAGVVVTLAFVILTFRRLNLIRRARLLSGGSLVSGMQGAMFALDLGLARDILVEREAVARGHVKPTSGKGLGATALIWRDAQRLVRFPKPFLGLAASALVPYTADALGLGFFMPFLAALALVAALIPFLGSLRVLSRTGGLARTFPFSTAQIRNATIVVPGLIAWVWAVAVFPAVLGLTGGPTRTVPDALMVTIAMGAAGLLGAVRWQTAKQVDYNRPMMATNAGGVQPSLIFNLFRGLDVVAAVTAPLILGAPLWVSLAIALVIYFLLRSGANMEEMQEQAKEEREALEREKAQRAGEKIKVRRPTR